MIRRISPFALAFVLMLSASAAYADTVGIAAPLKHGEQMTATMVCEFNSQTNTFTFTITNTTAITNPAVTESVITAIGFDLPPLGNASEFGLNGFTGAQAPSLSSNFRFTDADGGRVPGFKSATLDFLFVTGKTFARGDAVDGIAAGESASFVVSGAAFAGFTESDICNSAFLRFEGDGKTTGVPQM